MVPSKHRIRPAAINDLAVPSLCICLLFVSVPLLVSVILCLAIIVLNAGSRRQWSAFLTTKKVLRYDACAVKSDFCCMPEHAEHGAASSQPKLDVCQSLSTPSNAPTGPPGSPFMPWGWMTSIPAKPSPLDLTMDRGESFKLWKRRWESFFFSPVLFGRTATGDAVRRTGVVSCGRHIENGRQFRSCIGQEARRGDHYQRS